MKLLRVILLFALFFSFLSCQEENNYRQGNGKEGTSINADKNPTDKVEESGFSCWYVANFFIHLIVVTTFLGCAALLCFWIFSMGKYESAVNLLALILGILSYIGLSNGLELDFPTWAMSAAKDFGIEGKIFLATLVPALIGVTLSAMIKRMIQEGNRVACRFVVLFSTFLFCTMLHIYISTWSENSEGGFNPLLLPNLFFVIGYGIHLLTYPPLGDDA